MAYLTVLWQDHAQHFHAFHVHPAAWCRAEDHTVMIVKWIDYVIAGLHGYELPHPSANMDPDASAESAYVYDDHLEYETGRFEVCAECGTRLTDDDEHPALCTACAEELDACPECAREHGTAYRGRCTH